MEEGRLIDHWLGRENSLRDLFKLLGGDVAKLDNGITVADLDTTWEDLRRLFLSPPWILLKIRLMRYSPRLSNVTIG